MPRSRVSPVPVGGKTETRERGALPCGFVGVVAVILGLCLALESIAGLLVLLFNALTPPSSALVHNVAKQWLMEGAAGTAIAALVFSILAHQDWLSACLRHVENGAALRRHRVH